MKYKVGIVGCGKILIRHLESIEKNEDFELVALCDIKEDLLASLSKKHSVTTYIDFKEMVANEDINFVVIATPNSHHFYQAKYCLENGCDVLVEKPVCIDSELAKKISKIADKNSQKAYSVLQVRLNPVVSAVKEMLESGILGDVRGVSLTQRWQRPEEYFDDWRGNPLLGGGTLHECGIHYLDILCYLFEKPQVKSSLLYNTKHKTTTIEDTVYSLVDFGNFGGTVEITIATEPKNIECSISIMTEYGFIELGGKALDKITKVHFLKEHKDLKKQYEKITLQLKEAKESNSYGKYKGSCPNHPELYANLDDFDVSISFDSLDLITDIYKSAGVRYGK
jgi:UDP-N-acetyl-2-amino-2-deoxyglucuronate dehydrogenase